MWRIPEGKGYVLYRRTQPQKLTSLIATGIEGIFRLSGSEKRIKELKTVFDSPDRYGKGLVWDGYTVHDAANVLRRYLNDLPEPVVPLDLYEKFREPLRGATKQAVGDAEGPQFVENFDEKAAIRTYQALITELPPLNKQLLLYILDLLAVFAAKSDENRMNSQNLAAIFQPGMLSHPAHAMAPEEYRLNQCVIIFLIENQDHFLIGMQGTEADEKTKKDIEFGAAAAAAAPATPTTNRKSGLGRSASNASAGAHSVRRDGKIRRNRSVSSRGSKHDGSTTPNSPAVATTPTTGGLGRSNTVPSKKSPALAGAKFRKHDSPGQQSPAHLEPLTPARAGEQSEKSSLAPAAVGATGLSPGPASTAGRSQERLLDVPQEAPTPSKERNLSSIFQRSPTEGGDKRQPNKLKKKKLPGSLNPSAQSSNASLGYPHSNAASPDVENVRNPYEQAQPLPPVQPEKQPQPQPQQQQQQQQAPPPMAQQNSDLSSEPTPRASQLPSNNNLRPEDPSRGKSPPASIHSSFNEGSDVDQPAEDRPSATTDSPGDRKKRRWTLSRHKRDEHSATRSPPPMSPPPRMNLGSNDNADVSTTSIGSAAQKPRKSFTGESSDPTLAASEAGSGDGAGKDEKGPIGWIRHKLREAKDSADQRRNKSPPADRGSGLLSPRGKSMDVRRESRDEEKETKEAQPASQPAPAPETTQAPATAPPVTISEPAEVEPPVTTSQPAPPAPPPSQEPQAQPEAQPEVQPEVRPEAPKQE